MKNNLKYVATTLIRNYACTGKISCVIARLKLDESKIRSNQIFFWRMFSQFLPFLKNTESV